MVYYLLTTIIKKKHLPSPDDFTGEVCQTFREKIMPIQYKIFFKKGFWGGGSGQLCQFSQEVEWHEDRSDFGVGWNIHERQEKGENTCSYTFWEVWL